LLQCCEVLATLRLATCARASTLPALGQKFNDFKAIRIAQGLADAGELGK
jgi:hypothetical protein